MSKKKPDTGQWSEAAHDMMLADLFLEGFTIVVTGDRGSGKTFWFAWSLNWLLKHGYKVATNVIFKQCIGKTEDGAPIFAEGFPPGVTKVRTMRELFQFIGEELDKDRNVKLVFCMDEAGIGASAVRPVMKVDSRSLLYFSQLQRKFNCNSIYISTSPRMIMKALREEEGFLGAEILKSAADIRRYSDRPEQLYKRDIRDFFVLRMVDINPNDPVVLAMHEPIELPYCRPPHKLKVGDYTFSSKATATFRQGFYPNTKIAFSTEDCLDFVSDCIEELVPARIIDFIDNKGFLIEGDVAGVSAKKGGEEG